MDISKLTIQGFKSFYEKTTFDFGKKMTGIVGPNGSGKSNITEAIRFVLGEQSSKAMRGKDVTDMLFRGVAGKASKAKVEIFFKNTKRNILNFDNTDNVFIKNVLEKDDVSISRTIFEDGKGVYEMNGMEVRLKDINEFLLYVHLANKSSWHISQGEADRVLSASPTERKTIIEDALGLKVYHSRINEASKKLEKTRENIREATLQRKEILPEISLLGKQVERIKKSKEYSDELLATAVSYIKMKKVSIQNEESKKQNINSSDLANRIIELEKKISRIEIELQSENGGDLDVLDMELAKERKIASMLAQESSELASRNMELKNRLNFSSIEEKNILEELQGIDKELSNIFSAGNDIIFSEETLNQFKNDFTKIVKELEQEKDLRIFLEKLDNLDLDFKKLLTKGSVVTKDNVKQISYLQSIKNRLQEKIATVKANLEKDTAELDILSPKIENLRLKIQISEEKKNTLEKQVLQFNFIKTEKERDLQKMILEKSQISITLEGVRSLENKIEFLNSELLGEISDLQNFLGKNFMEKKDVASLHGLEIFQLKRNIERLKIRIEESNITNPEEVIEKYENLTGRDQFLLKEIDDLEKSIANLEGLISDLKDSLKNDFESGLQHINKIFDDYVKTLFGGGSAGIEIVELESRGQEEKDEQAEKKNGVEVEVQIPKKKVKGLHSLSGGERALVSIALNFAIINQNPAPFMLLDETDAALDEANSKRYGEILDKLKENSKLIVVTHNRETMHFADQIFGVTLHKDGHSKVLSVSFDDAVEYAK